MKTFICLLILLGTLLGCALNPDLPKETAKVYIVIELVDGYIDCGGVKAIGCSIKMTDTIYKIQVSKESPSHFETLEHELRHVYRWLYGFNPYWLGH